MKIKDIKLVKTLKLMWIIALVVWGAVIGINWYIASFDGQEKVENKSEKYIVQKIMDIKGLDKNGLVKMLGEPMEIYKEKMYIYEDRYAEYKLIVNNTVRSARVELSEGVKVKNIEKIVKEMGLIYSELGGEWIKKEEKMFEYKAYKVEGVSSFKINVINDEIESINIDF